MTSPWISDADLTRIRDRHEAIAQDELEPCDHLSASGIDHTWGPSKVWRCDECGHEFTDDFGWPDPITTAAPNPNESEH